MNQPFLNRPEGMSHTGLSDSQNSVAAKLIKKLLSILSYKSELQVFLRSSNKGYESKVSLLPVKARLCILRHPAYPTVQSDGQTLYFELLSHPILSFQRVPRDDATLTLDSLEYFFVCLLRYPTTNADINLIANNAGENHSDIYVYIYMCVCVCVCLRVCVCVYVFAFVCMYACGYVCVCIL